MAVNYRKIRHYLIWDQGNKTVYHGNLLPFHGNYQGNVVSLHHRIVVNYRGKQFYNIGPGANVIKQYHGKLPW
jgi:hypothetical protein